jgi:hypothetical protein
MNIQIKNIKFNEAFSEETICFTADIFVNGKKIGWAKNRGHGGCTDYWWNTLQDKEIFLKAQEFLQGSDSNMEHFIDDYVYDVYNAKQAEKANKKLERHFAKYVCYGKKGSNEYYTIGFKGSPNFSQVVKTGAGFKALQDLVTKVRDTRLSEGEEILNTNLSQFGIQF